MELTTSCSEMFPVDSPLCSHERPTGQQLRRMQSSFVRANFDPFAGSNQKGVFEDICEADLEVQKQFGGWDRVTSMEGWVFQEVSFKGFTPELFLSLPMHGASFWGCLFPGDITDDDVRRKGARYVMSNPESIPFKPLRAFLYTPTELAEKDADIYNFSKTQNTVMAKMAYALHDFSMLDAMYDYAEGKTFVGVMGGHQVKRGDASYQELVKLGNLIANTGFICVTGGGPGAMEACNLGAYLASHKYANQRKFSNLSDDERLPDGNFVNTGDEDSISLALALIRAPVDGFVGEEMLNTEAAKRVIDRFGPVQCFGQSVGIPTWYYGHEPSNMFASYHAKFFQNSIREDLLLDICNGGLIIGPGGPGTFQEVFQACCKNAYTRSGIEYPMVFFGKKFWTDSGVWDVVCKQARGLPYADLLMISDDVHEIVDHLYKCAVKKRYRLLEGNLREDLCNPYWYSRTIKENVIT